MPSFKSLFKEILQDRSKVIQFSDNLREVRIERVITDNGKKCLKVEVLDLGKLTYSQFYVHKYETRDGVDYIMFGNEIRGMTPAECTTDHVFGNCYTYASKFENVVKTRPLSQEEMNNLYIKDMNAYKLDMETFYHTVLNDSSDGYINLIKYKGCLFTVANPCRYDGGDDVILIHLIIPKGTPLDTYNEPKALSQKTYRLSIMREGFTSSGYDVKMGTSNLAVYYGGDALTKMLESALKRSPVSSESQISPF